MGGSRKIQGEDAPAPEVGSLVRRPAVVVRRRVLDGLRDAGFGDVLPAHLGVFQYPGPDGQRPGVLAVRTQASKQAMNHLLHQLEAQGYLVRVTHPRDRRTRIIRLTDRGWGAAEAIDRVVDEIDKEWRVALGEATYSQLLRGLVALEVHLDRVDQTTA